MTVIELIGILSQVHPEANVFIDMDLNQDTSGVTNVEWSVQGDRETWGAFEPGTIYLLNYLPTHLVPDEAVAPALLLGELSNRDERLHVT